MYEYVHYVSGCLDGWYTRLRWKKDYVFGITKSDPLSVSLYVCLCPACLAVCLSVCLSLSLVKVFLYSQSSLQGDKVLSHQANIFIRENLQLGEKESCVAFRLLSLSLIHI